MTEGHRPDMNPVLRGLLQTGKVRTADGAELVLHSQLPEREGLLVQHWLRQYQPTRLLEIGLAYGVSSLFICDVVAQWPLQHYHIIDAFQTSQWQGIGENNLRQAGFGNLVDIHEQLSELCLPQLMEQGYRYDFAYVDGWHTFDHVLVEFFYINRMLEIGGIVLFDDVHLPSLQKILALIKGYDCYDTLPMSEEWENSVPIKVRKMMGLPPARVAGFIKTAQDNRDWDWFKEF